jgi:acetyl-CoA carboxylase biotin carboxyl carrier protein
MTIEEIKEFIQIVKDTGIAELEVRRGENSVRVRGTASHTQEIVLPPTLPMHLATAAAVPGASVTKQEDERDIVVKSPIVGTYYDAPSPGSSAFVKPGDRVEPKQVLCIIESMKLMNEIESEVAGVVIQNHVENGRPVEYGESLFTIRPD